MTTAAAAPAVDDGARRPRVRGLWKRTCARGCAGTASSSGSTRPGHYSGFVERLQALRDAGRLPYEVHAFRGSHLALMMALDGVAAGTEKAPLVIHLPGFTEETVRQTPLFELYAAGVRYRKALDTLVTEAASGQVRPDQIDSFRAQPGMTLAGADAWLSALLDGAEGGGIGAQLRAMSPTAVLDDLLTGGIIAGRIGELDAEDALWERFAAWIGLPPFWRDATLPPSRPRAEDVAFAAASWALCVEYTDDLKRPPVSDHLAPAAALPRPVIDACRAVAAHLRERHAGFYQRTADETEALLADEVEQAQAEDLGEDRHVPVRGGQGPQGGTGRPGPRGLRPGRRVGRPARGTHVGQRVVLAPRRSRAAVRLAARPRRGPSRPGDRPRGRADRRGHARRRGRRGCHDGLCRAWRRRRSGAPAAGAAAGGSALPAAARVRDPAGAPRRDAPRLARVGRCLGA